VISKATYDIVEDFILVIILATGNWIKVAIFSFRGNELIMTPVTVIETEFLRRLVWCSL